MDFLNADKFSPSTAQLVESGRDMVYSGAGVAIGLIGAKFAGDFTEGIVTSAPIIATSTGFEKVIAWTGNNVPKVIAAFMLSKIKTQSEPVNMMITGGMYGCVGSLAIDTYGRAGNAGVPTLVLSGASDGQLKSLADENQALKSAITKMGSRLNHDPVIAQSLPVAPISEVASSIENAQQKRSVDQQFEFADQYMKRPIDEKFQFTGEVTSPQTLSTFGFMS